MEAGPLHRPKDDAWTTLARFEAAINLKIAKAPASMCLGFFSSAAASKLSFEFMGTAQSPC
jgi:hypothetical protein